MLVEIVLESKEGVLEVSMLVSVLQRRGVRRYVRMGWKEGS